MKKTMQSLKKYSLNLDYQVRQHNIYRLRIALKQKLLAKDNLSAEKCLRQDPHSFAAKHFGKQQTSRVLFVFFRV